MKKLIIIFMLLATNAYGYDSYTKLICHFNGANGATTDTALTGQTVNFVGTAQLSTTQKKFGVSSLSLDGDSDYVTIPYETSWDFGTGDFTIDFWFYFNDILSRRGLYVVGTEGSPGIQVFWDTGNNIYVYINAGATSHAFAWTPTALVWYHYAMVKTSGTFKLFINGNQIGTDWADATSLSAGSDTLKIGAWASQNFWMYGYIDEFRVSKGIARWTTNFTPPTREYDSPVGRNRILGDL